MVQSVPFCDKPYNLVTMRSYIMAVFVLGKQKYERSIGYQTTSKSFFWKVCRDFNYVPVMLITLLFLVGSDSRRLYSYIYI